MTNTVLAHISCQVDILRVTSAAIREQDHGAGAHSVHVTRNRRGAGPVFRVYRLRVDALGDQAASRTPWTTCGKSAGVQPGCRTPGRLRRRRELDCLTAVKGSAGWSQIAHSGAPGEIRTPDLLVRTIFLVAVVITNQSLAALADFDSGLTKAQLRHIQSRQAAIVFIADIHKTVLPRHPAPGPRSSA